MTLAATIAILATVPALAVLYREFLGAWPIRSSILQTTFIAFCGAAIWLALSPLVPGVVDSKLWLPTGALGAVAAFLASVAVRDVIRSRGTAVAFACTWSVLVFGPVALVVLFPSSVGLAGDWRVLDLGGAIAAQAAAGASAIAVLMLRGRRGIAAPRAAAPTTGSAIVVIVALLLWAGWTVGLVGLELAVDGVTPRIVTSCLLAPACAVVGWLAIQRIRIRTTTINGALAGLVSGLVAVTPGAAFLEPLWAILTGLIVGMSCAAFTLRRTIASGRRSWVVVGVHTLGAGIGLFILGMAGSGFGFIYIGQTAILQTQVVVTVGALLWSVVVSAMLWGIWLLMVRYVQREQRTASLVE